jgi:hypothetical protein
VESMNDEIFSDVINGKLVHSPGYATQNDYAR